MRLPERKEHDAVGANVFDRVCLSSTRAARTWQAYVVAHLVSDGQHRGPAH